MGPLFWRLCVINGAVFTIGTLALAFSPATVSSPVLLREILVLGAGLAIILITNALLLRRSLAPLTTLTALMHRIDLHTHDRAVDRGNGDLTYLIDSFNTMLERLETERSSATAHALAAQENERQRIARELHDEIGQSLTVALLGLKRVADRAPAELSEELQLVRDTVRGSLDEVRQVARRLRPGVLEDLGLHSALTALTADVAPAVDVNRRIEALPPLTPEAELVIYRIAQESLTNVVRHSKASSVWLTLRPVGHDLVLKITDDGIGGARADGAGMRGMQERALLIGARLTVTSEQGTEVTLTIPGVIA
ncbi:sensor histidine kinase [Herbidospora cretacea]|uniref:sensor histidine kinase n=1 Tax=Herbidospora cretacea TaxID=28444 RepID=UPI0004C3249A|nr:sensor histidine kinase [Herbidospora cretacea]